jgi:putative hydrolase of the HAD superfamily
MLFDKNSVVIFDLDDTLYKEIDFLKSAYCHIAHTLESSIKHNIYFEMLALHRQKAKVFEVILQKYGLETSVADLITLYREHTPSIKPLPFVLQFLKKLKKQDIPIGLITDGRSQTQRLKLKQLGIEFYFNHLIISEEFGSEKPCQANFLDFQLHFGIEKRFFYIADNPKKDFITPNQLGWTSIGLKDNGQNIHTQNLELTPEYYPKIQITSFKELLKNNITT